jgi:hypothetical protein
VLRHAVGLAAGYLGQAVSEAVVTIPAYFSEQQRAATLEVRGPGGAGPWGAAGHGKAAARAAAVHAAARRVAAPLPSAPPHLSNSPRPPHSPPAPPPAQAARLAGLQRVSLLQEPVAAAMAFGFGKPTEAETVLVFDLGGGTYDVSVLDSFEGIMEVGGA